MFWSLSEKFLNRFSKNFVLGFNNFSDENVQNILDVRTNFLAKICHNMAAL